MPHPLDSARERLNRADENILNLNREISAFVDGVPQVNFKGQKPVWTDQDREAFERIKQHIIKSRVEPRFAVLCGEIIHHLRSGFDHIAWQLSTPEARIRFMKQIEFPIYKIAPTHNSPNACIPQPKKLCGYCRKVQGIASANALARIEGLQPYRRSDPPNDFLWLINEMDIVDKHRELVVVVNTLNVSLRAVTRMEGTGEHYPWEIKPRRIDTMFPVQTDIEGNVSAQVSFRQFRYGKETPVIDALRELLRFSRETIEGFAVEFH